MERGHPCPPEREARTAAERGYEAAERASRAGGQDVRAPSRLPVLTSLHHHSSLTKKFKVAAHREEHLEVESGPANREARDFEN